MTNNQDKLAFVKAMELSNPVICEECNNEFFEEVLILRKVSKLITGNGKDEIQPVPVLRCANCRHVNSEFLPKFNKSIDKPE